VPGLQALDATSNKHRRDVPTLSPIITSAKDPTFAIYASVPFRPQWRASRTPGWYQGRRPWSSATSSSKKFRRDSASPCGNTGTQMGGLGSARRSRRSPICPASKMRIGGQSRGQVLQKVGVVPQQLAGGDHLPGAGKGHHRRRRVGRSFMTTRSLGFREGRESYYYYPGFWEGRSDGPRLLQIWRSGIRFPKNYQAILTNANRECQQLDGPRVYDIAESDGAEAPWSPAAPSFVPSPTKCWKPA